MSDEISRESRQGVKEPDMSKSEETVGEILLSARDRAGMTLEEIGQCTKIPVKMLEYLETDNFEAIPAKVYVKGFLRSYAESLGLDAQHIINKYEVQTGQTHRSKGDYWEIDTEVVEEQLSSPRIFRRYVIPAVIVFFIIILILKIGRERGNIVEPPSSLPDVKEEILGNQSHQVTAERGEDARSGIEESGDVQLASDVAVEPVKATEEMELRLVANPADSCWFEILLISTAVGRPDTSFEMFLLRAGKTRTLHATDAFVFKKVGNPGGFVMELNGKKLKSLGERGRVRSNVKITVDDLTGN